MDARRSGHSAPSFSIQPREVIAVEHPMVIKNIDKGLKTFGNGAPYQRIFEAQDDACVPLYLRPQDPMCAPILSHNAATNCVLLKITVPKRTGRKRKRGSQDPYSEDPSAVIVEDPGAADIIGSQSRIDDPVDILRRLKDNSGKYEVDAVAEIESTHRYRGPADFYQSTAHGRFMTSFRENALSADPEKMRQFQFDPSTGPKENDEIIPPPAFTDHSLPFNWGYHQNPASTITFDKAIGQLTVLNTSRPASTEVSYLAADCEDVPQEPSLEIPDEPPLLELIARLKVALDERPIWTRRALVNHMRYGVADQLLKRAFQFAGYQFRGGPFRDTVIKFGVDPRADPSYRIYQTAFFKIYNEIDKKPGQPWKDIRSEYTKARVADEEHRSHIFDGKTLLLDGKVWQICDITDPILQNLIANAPVRDKFEVNNGEGWFCNGTWAKIKGIMKTKLIAIRAHKTLPDEVFASTLAFPDEVDTDKRGVNVPLPKVQLTEEDIIELKEKGLYEAVKASGLTKKRGGKSKRTDRIKEAFQQREHGNPKSKKSMGKPLDISGRSPARNSAASPSPAPDQNRALDPVLSEEVAAYNEYLAEMEALDAEDGLEVSEDEYDEEEEFESDDDGGFHHRRYEMLKSSYPGLPRNGYSDRRSQEEA